MDIQNLAFACRGWCEGVVVMHVGLQKCCFMSPTLRPRLLSMNECLNLLGACLGVVILSSGVACVSASCAAERLMDARVL